MTENTLHLMKGKWKIHPKKCQFPLQRLKEKKAGYIGIIQGQQREENYVLEEIVEAAVLFGR